MGAGMVGRITIAGADCKTGEKVRVRGRIGGAPQHTGAACRIARYTFS
jgi:hypothetical protein